jgi:amino acid transporter
MSSTLKKDVLIFREVLFQGIAASAPAGAAVATLTGAAAFALGSLPLATLIAFVIVVLNALVINRISYYVAGSGGYYEYAKQGFGAAPSLFTGWIYIIYQVFALAFIGLSISVFVPALLTTVFSITIPTLLWIPLLIGTLGFGFVISFLGIKGSLRYATVVGSIEILVVVAVGVAIAALHPAANTLSVFTPKYATGGFTGVALGILFAYTAFAGYGGATPLGEESKTAKKTVGKAVLYSSIILGLFFVFAAYSFTIGWGPFNMGTFATSLVPGISLSQTEFGDIGAIVLTVLFINSILTDAVVFTNSASRVVMTLSRDGVLPRRIANIHEIHRTPAIAGALIVVAAILVAGVSTVALGGGGFNAFIMTGIVATLGTLLVHMIVNASLPRILRKNGATIGIINILLPVVTIGALIAVFYGTFVSISLPVTVGSYIFTGWSIAGLIYALAMRRKVRPSIPVEKEPQPSVSSP